MRIEHETVVIELITCSYKKDLFRVLITSELLNKDFSLSLIVHIKYYTVTQSIRGLGFRMYETN